VPGCGLAHGAGPSDEQGAWTSYAPRPVCSRRTRISSSTHSVRPACSGYAALSATTGFGVFDCATIPALGCCLLLPFLGVGACHCPAVGFVTDSVAEEFPRNAWVHSHLQPRLTALRAGVWVLWSSGAAFLGLTVQSC